MKTREFSISTDHEGMYNITARLREVIRESGVQSGLAVVYCPHTTAGITINENADPDVQHDLLLGLREAFPDRREFRHAEGNSTAHLKCSYVGPSQTVLIEDWQAPPRHLAGRVFLRVRRSAPSPLLY